MNKTAFQTEQAGKAQIKVTPLVRATELKHQGEAWSAPDLQAVMVQESKKRFEMALAEAKAEIAEALAVMRDAELAAAREAGLKLGRDEGYEKGYALGYQEGRAVADAQAKSEKDAFDASKQSWLSETQQQTELLLVGVTQSLSEVEDALMKDMMWLTAEMAQRLVMDALQLQPERVNQLVERVLHQLPQVVYPIQLFLNPADVDRMSVMVKTLNGRVDLHSDEGLKQGECLLKSGHSELTLSWQTQTKQVLDMALAELSKSVVVPIADDVV